MGDDKSKIEQHHLREKTRFKRSGVPHALRASREYTYKGIISPCVHVLELKSFVTAAQPVSPRRILGSGAGLNNASLTDKERRKRNDRASGYEHPNRMRSLDFL